MDVLAFKLEFKAFMKILQEIRIEAIQFKQLKKLLQLQKIVLIRLSAIWCQIYLIWEFKETSNHLNNFLKIQLLDLMVLKYTQPLSLEVLDYMNFGKMENTETIIPASLYKL